ncbi:probable inactive receptor kinase At2g26730 [Hordeum vulgare subsp. vulgare]|uniref:Protein kinase domain-containing protein n=1 Tax=Hordeum vulgare subsp. vulgare TaxID=112509 RepID=A0A8I6X7L3_HORVV|nr:probable inactive receptor kinase At2g26730 [Hordeum vulgare subsp. vulgare]
MASAAALLLAAAVVALLACLALADPPASEQSALLAFLAATPHERKLGWSASTPACAWVGVTCDAANSTVIKLRLPGVGLVGPIPPSTIGRLTNLQVLSLRANRVSGAIPDDILRLSALRSVFLQDNAISGAIPPGVSGLAALERLVLSHNNLSGPIPFALGGLAALRALRLDGNRLSGKIPSIANPELKVFNVSNNRLNGSIPRALARFPADAFAGNLQLCGTPLPPCSPFFPSPSPAPGMGPSDGKPPKKKKVSTAAIVGIIVAAVVVALLLVLAILFCCKRSRRGARTDGAKGTAAAATGTTRPPASSGDGTGTASSPKDDAGTSGSVAAAGGGTGEASRLVFVGKGAGYSFDLEDLLRASAEVLGKGSAGTSYKAVLEEGTTVVVKRLKEVSVSRREFEAHMETVVGGVEHPNLLPVRAYYFSKDEKLLVYDYLPAGSLSAMLHGSRGSGRTPMDWDARMRSALSTARGLAHLHSAHKLAHGNVKSTNVLLRPDHDAAALSDFCLHPIYAPSSVRAGSNGYRAPEVVDTRRPTLEADVYSLGVLLLELLTGKSPTHASLQEGDGGTLDLPRWVQSVVREEWTAEVFDVELVRLGASAEEEMVALLQVAMACVATVPDARPDAPDVVRMIEEIGAGHGQTTTEESARATTSEEERSPAAQTS